MKKYKRKRDYTSMKSVGIKSIDETFKVRIDFSCSEILSGVFLFFI